jgi:prepilin-type N-terminal cleavage/methylation domain-containing protein
VTSTAQSDRGITLTELLIVVSVMGVLAVAIAATFSVIVRTSPGNERRLDDARTLLGLSTWLPEDVSSTPPISSNDSDGFAAPGAQYICAGTLSGTSLLHLRHSDAATGITYARDYVLVTTSNGATRVERHSCVEGGAASVTGVTGPLSVPGTCAAPAALSTPARVTLQRNDLDEPIGVEFDLLIDCGIISVQALSNNPAEAPLDNPDPAPTPSSVATTTTPATEPPEPTEPPDPSEPTDPTTPTTPPPSTTTTTTTIPCTGASITTHSPNNKKVSNGAGDNVAHLRNNDTITIRVNRGNGCSRLGFEVDPMNSDSAVAANPASYNPIWIDLQGGTEVTIRSDDFLWSDGFHTFRLRNGATSTALLGSITFQVSP